MRSIWAKTALIAFLGVLLGACAPRKSVTPPADLPPQAPGRTPQTVRPWAGEAELLDPGVVDREIRKREAAVAAARSKREELSGTRRAVLDAWATALEDQIGRLQEINREARALSSIPEPQERARRSKRITDLLMECLSLSPLEPPVGAGGARVVEETRISWEPVRSAFQRGDCVWLLQEYEALSRAHSEVNTPSDVQIMRGICLGRSGKRQEALRILEPLAGQGLLLDAQQVKYLTANWLFEEGQLEKAAERYKSLLEAGQERDRWAELARLRLEQIRLRKGEPPARMEAQTPSEASTQALQEPPAPSLSFPQREPIPPAAAQPPPLRESPPEQQLSLPQPQAPVGVPQQPTPSTAGGQEMQLARLQEAQRLMDAEQYEQAIETLQQVQGSSHEEQARKGIQEAQDRYAEKRRKEAAELVLKAREEGGSKRKANLLKALEILEETNRKYPNNRYAAKIQQNIQDLLGQIRAIDPSFRN